MKFPKHSINISIIVILALFIFSSWLNLYEVPYRGDPNLTNIDEAGDWIAYNAVNAYITRNSILNKHDLTPLWNPFLLSGTPFFLKPQVPVYYIQTVFLLLSPNSWLGMKLSMIFHFILAGISMYFLILYLKIDSRIALAASIIFAANPYIMNEITRGHINILYPYSLFPLVILFTLKAFESKNWLNYSIIVGILFALQVHSGGQSIFLFSGILFGYILFFNIFGKNIKNRALKAFLIGSLVLIILLGLTAVKVLPSSEFIEISSRQQPFSYERSTDGGISLSSLFGSGTTSLLAIILSIPSLFYFKKKKFLLFFIMFIITMLILTASPFYYLLWKYIPFLDKQKGIFKATFLLTTSISIFSAYGMSFIQSKIKKIKFNKFKLRNYISYLFVILIIGNFIFFGKHLEGTSNIKEQIDKNNILQFISKQPEKLRFHTYETNGIDWGIGHVSVPLGLEDVYGYDNIWIPEYLPQYLSIANSQRAKLFGVLNMKYLTSMNPLNISGFKFVEKFDDCGVDSKGIQLCQSKKSRGPYLYENELFLPRAFFVDHGILVVGNRNQAIQNMYGLMLDSNFDPSNTVIIAGNEKINSYDSEFLKKFDMIMLLPGSIDSNSIYLLESYVKSGGTLFPDVTKSKQSFTMEEIQSSLKKFSGSYDNVASLDIREKTYDEIYIDSKGKKGFLVLSEKFSIFPGWNAKDEQENDIEILKANGIISAVYLDSPGLIKFSFMSKSFKAGLAISLLTLLTLIIYGIYIAKKKWIDKKK